MRVIHRGLILTGVPLILAMSIVGIMFALVLETDRERVEETQHRKVYEAGTRVMLRLFDAGCCLEHLLEARDVNLKERFKRDIAELRTAQADLVTLSAHEAQSQEMIAKWNEHLDNFVEQFRNVLRQMRSPHFGFGAIIEASRLRNDFANKSYALVVMFHNIVAEPIAYLDKAPQRQQLIYNFQCGVLLVGVLGGIALALLLARWFMTEITNRLKVIADNSSRLSRGQPLLPLVKGTDEIADLDKSFHAMSETLAAAMAKERAIFQSASDIICIFDKENKFAAVNPACARILGYEPQDLVGTKLVELTNEEDVAATAACLDTVRGSEPSSLFENRVRMRNGDYLDLLWSVYWSKSQGMTYAVAHDISESKRVERMKEEFLSMVSHDLRSPLASIFGTFELMQMGVFGALPEKVVDKTDMVTRNVSRLLSLINDLLDLGKLETGKFELTKQDVDLSQLLERAKADVEPLAEKRGIKITIKSSATSFHIDPDRITQVLINLLSNAIKFSPDGGEVVLAASQDQNMLNIQVIDQGRGVPESHKLAIFERFKQVEISDSKSKGGTGLGLPICKQIVELHGGQIGVESETGQGSTFWLTIPAKAETVQEVNSVPLGSSGAERVLQMGLSSPRLSAVSGRNLTVSARHPAPPEVATSQEPQTLLARALLLLRSFSFNDLQLSKKGAILVIVPVLFEVIFAASMFALLDSSFHEKQQEQHARTIATNAANLLITFYEIGTVICTDKTEKAWEGFLKASHDSLNQQSKLIELTRNDAQSSEIVGMLVTQLRPADEFILDSERAIRAWGPTPANMEKAWSKREDLERVMTGGMPFIEQLIDLADHRNGASPFKTEALRSQQGFLLASSLILSVIICAITAWLFSIGITRRVRVINENTHRLETSSELNEPLPGKDEIAHLDHVFHSMAQAITEARAKERAVFDNSQGVMGVINEGSTIVRINPACQRLWGYEPSEMVGRSLLNFVVDEDRSLTERALVDDLHLPNRTFENRVRRKDGTICNMVWSLSWSPDEQSNIVVAHDITKRKELEQLKQEFLSMVSHDMRTPLAAIQGVTKLMNANAFGPLPENAVQQLTGVERSCDRLLSLVNDLLDMDKLESGNMELQIQPTSAVDVLERTCQSLESFAKQHKVTMKIDAPAGLQVNGDGDRLVQVGVNLLSNAIKYSPEGGVVTISAESSGEFIDFRIVDSGPGIPESYLETIFDRYTMAPSVDGKKRAGTGLGLPICKQIVEQHGGQIGVFSEIGKGSTFWFRIPGVVAQRTVSGDQLNAGASKPPA